MKNRHKIFLGIAFSFLCLTQHAKSQSLMDSYSQPFLDKLIQAAKENYPRPKSMDLRIESAKTELTRVKLNWLDILSVSFIYNPNYTFNPINPNYFQGIQLGVSFNLATTLQKPSNVKSARINVKVAELDKAEYLLSLETQVTTAYLTYLNRLADAKTTDVSYYNSDDLFKQQKARYEKSEITYDLFNQAIVSHGAVEMSRNAAQLSLILAKRSLEELLGGRKLEEFK